MLLIDGVKYKLWTPSSEDEFEQIVIEHASEIFGENSVYIDRKLKLKSLSGIGSIPDGYVVVFGDSPEWHIVEVELSSHPLYEHIVSQISRFINGISNPNTQKGIVNAIDGEITRDAFLRLRLRKAIEPTEIYRFLSDVISRQPILTIIIEKDTDELREALNTLRYPQINVVEFQTFTREGTEDLTVHAHLFKPLYQAVPKKIATVEVGKNEIIAIQKTEGRVTIKDLLDAGIIKPSQVIFGYRGGKKYEASILDDGAIKLLHDGSKYNSLSLAAYKGIVGHEVNGWKWWHTTRGSGKECRLDELRKEYESNPALQIPY